MSSSNPNQEGKSLTRATRSTRSNTTLPDEIVHQYISERRNPRPNITLHKEEAEHDKQVETEIETEILDKDRRDETSRLEISKEPDTIDEPTRSESPDLDEIQANQKFIEETLESLEITAQAIIAADEILIAEGINPRSRPLTLRPGTPTVHRFEEIDNSDSESVNSVINNFSENDIDNTGPFFSLLEVENFDVTSALADESDETFYTPEGDFAAPNKSLGKRDAAKRTLFPIHEVEVTDNGEGSGRTKPGSENKIQTNKFGDEHDNTFTEDSVKTQTVKRDSKYETTPSNPSLHPIKKFEMANSSLKVSLKDALTVVPTYDGVTASLNSFIQGCDEALEMIDPGSEEQLVKAVRIKIVGEPRRSIAQQTFGRLKELYDFLKCIYAPARNIYQLQGELGSIFQKPEESVVAYANRVRDLGFQILEAYESENNAPADAAFKRNTTASLPPCFIQGLKPEIEARMSGEGTIDDIVKRAVKIEKQLIARAALREGIKDSPDPKAKEPRTETKRSIKAISSEELECQLCNKSGHVVANCPDKPRGPMADPPDAGSQGKNVPVCQHCEKRGHVASKCFKLFPPPNNNPGPKAPTITVCQNCDKRGHTADRCYKLFPPTNRGTVCQICHNPGHDAKNCSTLGGRSNPSSSNQNSQVPQALKFQQPANITCQICKKQGHGAYLCPYRHNSAQCPGSNQPTYADAARGEPKLSGTCHYCKQTGHFIRDCPVRLANEARYGKPSGNSSGLPTSGASGTTQSAHPIHTISVATTNNQEL